MTTNRPDPTPAIVVFEATPTYEEWCGANQLDPDDDDNVDRYCEWEANQ